MCNCVLLFLLLFLLHLLLPLLLLPFSLLPLLPLLPLSPSSSLSPFPSLVQGATFSVAEATQVFFAVTKLWQSKDVSHLCLLQHTYWWSQAWHCLLCVCVHVSTLGLCLCLFVCVQVSLRRLVYCAVRVMASMSQDVIIVTSSLTKDMTGKVGEGVVMIGVLRVCAYGCASLRGAVYVLCIALMWSIAMWLNW